MVLWMEIRFYSPGHACHSNSNSVKQLWMLRHRYQSVRDDCAAGRDCRHSDSWESRVTTTEELGDWCCMPRESGFSSFYGWTVGSPIPSEKSLMRQWCPDQLDVTFFSAKFWAKSKLHCFPHHLKSLHYDVSHSKATKLLLLTDSWWWSSFEKLVSFWWLLCQLLGHFSLSTVSLSLSDLA